MVHVRLDLKITRVPTLEILCSQAVVVGCCMQSRMRGGAPQEPAPQTLTATELDQLEDGELTRHVEAAAHPSGSPPEPLAHQMSHGSLVYERLPEGDAWRRPGWPNAAELLAERLRRGSVVAGARVERAGAARQAFAGARAGEIAKPRTRQ